MGLRIVEMVGNLQHPFPYGFFVLDGNVDDLDEVTEWCLEQFGPMSATWKRSYDDYWFSNASHAMVFKIRWL